MKPARLIVLLVALGAGAIAALMAGRSDAPPPEPPQLVPTTQVLVAKGDIGMGRALTAENLQWQVWPLEAANAGFIQQSSRAEAIGELTGSIARSAFVAGEPIRETKLIKGNGSGFMSAILPSGMRAVSTEISPETGAGGFILPNDRVDVILTRRQDSDSPNRGTQGPPSETILSNIRVLAIDQDIEEKNGQRVVIGKTATLELGPGQAERLTLGRQLGVLSLALRSIADANAPQAAATTSQSTNVVRFGVSRTISTTATPQ